MRTLLIVALSTLFTQATFASAGNYQTIRQVMVGEWQTEGSCNHSDPSLFSSGDIISLYFDQRHPYLRLRTSSDGSLPSWLSEPRTRTSYLKTSPDDLLNSLVTNSERVYTSSSDTSDSQWKASIDIFKVLSNGIYECNSRKIKGPCHIVDSTTLSIHTTNNGEFIHIYSGVTRTAFKFGEKKLNLSDINHRGTQLGFGCSRLRRVR